VAKPSTVADVWGRFKYVVTLLNELDKSMRTNTGAYSTLYDLIPPQIDGDYLPGVLGPLSVQRAALSSLLSPQKLKDIGTAFALEFGRVLGCPETNPAEIMRRVRIYMAELSPAAQTLNRREMTFGSLTAGGSNTGTGTIHRVSTDEYGYPIENVMPDLLTFKIVQDQNSVNKHEEVFEVRGGDPDRDYLVTETGSGIVDTLTCKSARDTESYLTNPSFTSYSGSGATLDFTGWTLSSATVFEASTTTYKGYVGESTGYSIKFIGNGNFYQEPTEDRQTKFDSSVPWFFGFPLYRGSSCDGTLTVQLGGITRDITISSLSDSAWTYCTLPASLGQSNWYRAWKADSPDIKFTLASWTTGYLLVDDLCLVPMKRIGGHYYTAVGGATSFLCDDYFTITNALESTRAKIAYWAWRLGWPNFPTATGAGEVITDPADPT
jgi:hypothetical protein